MNPKWSGILDGMVPISRALALFFGAFGLCNLLGNLFAPGFDANLWWIDLRALPNAIAQTGLLAGSLAFLWFAWRPARTSWRRWATAVIAATFCLAALYNALTFWRLVARGFVVSELPIPLSLLVAAGLAMVGLGALSREPSRLLGLDRWVTAAAFVGVVIGFPIAQMLLFGSTDYRRKADVAVVLGARAYANGQPSRMLRDRVQTACQLYQDGLAAKLLFSGGPGDGETHETECMRRLAIELGVPPEAIELDPNGLNTQATVKNTATYFSRAGVRRALAVSHYYHLPRVKLAYQRAGWNVCTVPARGVTSYRLPQRFVFREVPALWLYYLRPLFQTEVALRRSSAIESGITG